jgi:hypothetical protein
MAKRKIYDILPPGERKREKGLKPLKRIDLGSSAKDSGGGVHFFSLILRPWCRPRVCFLFIFSTIFIGFLFFFFTISPRAEIEIWPETESLRFSVQATVESSADQIDFDERILPGKIIVGRAVLSQEFPATGKVLKEEKARGMIRVYNAYSIYDQPLVATTRFVSAEGKLFRTPKRIVVPGGHYEGGKLVPGFIDIEVVADRPGEEYNIGPSTFSIPGFAGTAKYTSFYGKSFESMSGGSITEVSRVTREDLEKARDSLEETALKESRASLKRKISSDWLKVKGAEEEEVVESLPLAEAGQEADSFIYQVEAEVRALVFKRSDLEVFAKNYFLSQISAERAVEDGTLQVKYAPQSIEMKKGKIVLIMEISARVYSVIDQQKLKKIVQEKSPSEVNQILSVTFPQILKAETRLWPFWARKVPRDPERIEVLLKF